MDFALLGGREPPALHQHRLVNRQLADVVQERGLFDGFEGRRAAQAGRVRQRARQRTHATRVTRRVTGLGLDQLLRA